MLKIGEFSKLSRVSVRMLRYYDEIGLLRPEHIDPFTDYRYYSESQLPTVCRIAALRDMGFPLAEIRALLPIYDDSAQLDACLAARQTELRRHQAEVTQQLLLLDTARKRLRKEESMTYNVTIKTLPARTAATVRMTVPRYEDEGMLWHYLFKETAALNIASSEPPFRCVTFLDGEFKERDVTLEAQLIVNGSYPDTEHVRFRALPAVTYASCTFRGGYHQFSEVIAAMTAWIEANGYAYDGFMFDIYHVSPHETQNPDEFVTEVCYPVCRKDA